jgi:uncharacterized membrane protein
MLGLIDPEKKALRLSRLVLWDLVAVLLLTGLLVGHVIPLRTGVAIGYGALFVANLLVARRATSRSENGLQRPDRIPRISWFAAFAFTAVGIAAAVAWVRKADLSSTVQVVIAIVLVSYIWFLIYRLKRTTKGQTK